MAKKKTSKKLGKKSAKKNLTKRSTKAARRSSKKAEAKRSGKKRASSAAGGAKAKRASAQSKRTAAKAKSKKKGKTGVKKKAKASKASKITDDIVIEAGESDPSLKGVPISRMTAKQLHLFVENYNWDGGCKPILGVIRHPKCELGTALLAYWLGSPDFACEFTKATQVPSYYREEYNLLMEIERRVEQGAYKSARIAFNPHNIHGHDFVASIDPKQMKRPIPSVMMQKTGK